MTYRTGRSEGVHLGRYSRAFRALVRSPPSQIASATLLSSPKLYVTLPHLLKQYAQFCWWRDAKVAKRVEEPQPTKSKTYNPLLRLDARAAGLLRDPPCSTFRNTTSSGRRPSRSHTRSAASINLDRAAAE